MPPAPKIEIRFYSAMHNLTLPVVLFFLRNRYNKRGYKYIPTLKCLFVEFLILQFQNGGAHISHRRNIDTHLPLTQLGLEPSSSIYDRKDRTWVCERSTIFSHYTK